MPYEWVDVDLDAPARALAEALAGGLAHLPVVIFPDGSHLVAPTTAQLAEKAGMQTHANLPILRRHRDRRRARRARERRLRRVGRSCAPSSSRRTRPGGQAGTSSLIENYLGFPAGVTGADLAQRATAQARRFGAELLTGQEVVALRREDPYRVVVLADGTELTGYCV